MNPKNMLWSLVFLAGLAAMNSANAGELSIERGGWAGKSHRDNIYELEIDKESKGAKLRFWIRGAGGMDSVGTVELIDTEGKKHIAYSWTPDRLEKVAKDTTQPSFKGANLVEVEMGRDIEKPGRYKVVFQYKRGKHALVIEKVEIKTPL